jgi:hypothetical protein
VVVVSSPDSPTSEESSPSPSPETEDVKKPLVKSAAAITVGLTLQQRTATLRKHTGGQQKYPPSTTNSGNGIMQGASGLLPSTTTELVPNGTADDLQQQIQTPTSSTTTEDSRKEATAREADGEASDEEKEGDGDDEDEEDRRMLGMDDDVHTTSNDEEE